MHVPVAGEANGVLADAALAVTRHPGGLVLRDRFDEIAGHHRERTNEVPTHERDATLDVALTDRVEEGIVIHQGASKLGVWAARGEGEEDANGAPQAAPDTEQAPVVSGLVEGGMKCQVGIEGLGRSSVLDRTAHPRDAPFEIEEKHGVRASHRAAHREFLDRRAQRIDLLDVMGIKRCDEAAAALDPHSEPFHFEFADGLANRTPAHAEVFGQLDFTNPLARSEFPGEDEASELVMDELPSLAAVDGSPGHGHLPRRYSGNAGDHGPAERLVMLAGVIDRVVLLTLLASTDATGDR